MVEYNFRSHRHHKRKALGFHRRQSNISPEAVYFALVSLASVSVTLLNLKAS